jgi:aspartate/methionine/tyrosine aminotransferase
MSKCFGAGGWRLGYMIIPEEKSEVRDAILKVASESYSAVAAPIQFAVVPAYRQFFGKEIQDYLGK